MQKILICAGIICLALAGFMSADRISSSISVDGSSWIKSSLTGDKTYATLLFTNDRSTINRGIEFSKDIETQTRVLSSGPVGVLEYSAQSITPEAESWRCMFVGSDQTNDRYDEISTTGLWSGGNYTGVRSMSENLTTASTDITGTGMVSLSKHSETVNLTQNERAVAAGKMNVSEYVEYGGCEMNLMSIVTVVSLVVAISNGIGMILMYLRYAKVIRGAIMAVRTSEGGEVEIVDLLSDISRISR